ncbi:MAG: DUF5715 family protein [Patescibacteria group bacterium]
MTESTQNTDQLEIKKQQEWQRIMRETEIERRWYTLQDKYLDSLSEAEALNKGELIRLPREGEGWRLIGRLNGEPEGEPNSIRPDAYVLLEMIAKELRIKTAQYGDIYAAVTSLYRSLADQQRMSESLSAKGTDSSHLAGAAIDISLRSYYTYQDGNYASVNSWSSTSEAFQTQYADDLVQVVNELKEKGLCNYVVEKVPQNGEMIPSVLHICVNPEFSVLIKKSESGGNMVGATPLSEGIVTQQN